VTDLDVEVTMNMGGRILLFFCCILGKKEKKMLLYNAVYCKSNQCSGGVNYVVQFMTY